MKIKKSITRSYLGCYLTLVFADVLSAMMAIKIATSFLVILFVLDFIALALLITSNVFLYKNKKLHPYFLLISVSLIDILLIIGTILQVIVTIEGTKYGEASVYGWIIYPIGLIIMGFASYFLIRFALKQIRENNNEKYMRKHSVVVDNSKKLPLEDTNAVEDEKD